MPCAPAKFDVAATNALEEIQLQENTLFDILNVIGNIAQCPIHHVAYAPAKFEAATYNGLGAKSQILSSVAPPGRKSSLLFSVSNMFGGLRNSCFTKFSVVILFVNGL